MGGSLSRYVIGRGALAAARRPRFVAYRLVSWCVYELDLFTVSQSLLFRL